MATIHAHNPKGVITRMTQLYKQNNIPSMTNDEIKDEIHDVIDIIVQLERDGGKRYISAIYYKEAG
jgi:type IV secretion system protein VirB11